ncbi:MULTISPECIES: LysE family translocator [Clostridia]|uniref:LysE family translocator n=1 Tax=Clostridia TaxID=186801 RepID=UPI000EA07778|nr:MULTISPECIES: LysE family translocator [Clostridia]NBJ69483.1 amino acid transporter [Roseburia sp. 1XD42-34]RKI78558.1 amino acid transporter [Clostridium sp. 1xD42-85]
MNFLGYILLGISLSAPVGPINAAQLNKGMHHGFIHAWLVGLGGMIGDLIFMLLIYFGVAQFLTTPFMKTFLWLFGFFILVYTGIESITGAKKSLHVDHAIRQTSKMKSFRTGFLLAISNPLNIIFWLGIYGAVLAKTSDLYSNYQLLLYSSGIFLGIFLWDVIMAGVASSFRRFFHERVQYFITIGAGLLLIGFGLYFGYEAVLLLTN